jgi:hypothetical protein
MGQTNNSVRLELVEGAVLFFIGLAKEERPFDKLRANGVLLVKAMPIDRVWDALRQPRDAATRRR